MKRVGVVSTAFLLFVLPGATAFGREQQGEKQGKPAKQAEPARLKEQQQQRAKPAQQQPRHAQQPKPQARPAQQVQRTQQQRHAQEGEQQHTWQQRGGYNGYSVPDNYFRSHYGRDRWFRVHSLPFLVVGGFPRFQYDG
jgi:outer membrane biosynthesis protein TonB